MSVTGPAILFTIPILGGINITETILNGWLVVLIVLALSLFLTHNLKTKNPSKRQLAAEKIYSMLCNMVQSNMGERYVSFTPYIGGLFAYSIFGSLLGLVGLRAVTADMSTTVGMAVVTFFMIEINNIYHNGVLGWMKSFTEPVAIITPINIISEVANVISMSFRHFGNIVAGVIISDMVYWALANFSSFVLGWIPNTAIASIPIFQIGIPALLSIYFDLFSSFLQAYIISMLTMVNVSRVTEA